MKISFKPQTDAHIQAFIVDQDGGLPAAAGDLDAQSGGLLSEALAAERFSGKLAQQAIIVAVGPRQADLEVESELWPGALSDRLAASVFDGFRLEPVSLRVGEVQLRVAVLDEPDPRP